MDTYTRWDEVPDTLKTKTALGKMGLRLAKGQEPTAVKTHWDNKIPDYKLYTVAEAVPKRTMSEKQKEALAKAQEASLRRRTCTQCGYVEELGRRYRNKVYVRNGVCDSCTEETKHKAKLAKDEKAARNWAREVLAHSGGLILDTETTGMDYEDQIIEIAIIDMDGNVLLDTLLKPTVEISEGATAVHGLIMADLENAPTFADIAGKLHQLLDGQTVVVYNRDFDVRMLAQTAVAFNITESPENVDWHCAMIQYARWFNEWSRYWEDYKWQPLYGATHRALGDCLATLAYLRRMANE